MQIHNVKRNHPNVKSRQVGRGGKRGKTSGRGGKGQTARAGAKVRPALREVVMKLPKLRGYRFKSFRPQPLEVSLGTLELIFSSGETVNPATLLAKGAITTRSKTAPRVKILGGGALTKKLVVSGCGVSSGARAAIEKAGGVVN